MSPFDISFSVDDMRDSLDPYEDQGDATDADISAACALFFGTREFRHEHEQLFQAVDVARSTIMRKAMSLNTNRKAL